MSGGWLSKGCCTPVAADFFVKRRWSVWLIEASARAERMYTALVGRATRAIRVYELAACKTLASYKNEPRRKSLIYRSNCKARTQIDRLDGNTPAAAASGSENQLQLNQGQPTIAARRRKHSH